MRLHSLSVQAFGPFAGTEHVDFDALHDAGLFLLTGPTGAGKTSVLDAVVFAVYGVVPGARAGAGRLRSDHAAQDTVTTVVLEMTCRGRRFRVTRSPAWDRPKRRGTGTVREQARVLLEEVHCDGPRTVSTRLDEAGHLLRDVVGLTPAQFCQVALLPQGEFASFLRADADTRRSILQTLFSTERFSSVEAWLVERRRSSARALDGVEEQLRILLARAEQEAGPRLLGEVAESPEVVQVTDDAMAIGGAGGAAPAGGAAGRAAGSAAECTGDGRHDGEWLRRLVHAGRAAADATSVAAGPARAALESARVARDEAVAALRLRARASSLRDRAAAVEQGREARARAAEELDAARRAAGLRPLVDAMQSARRELDRQAARVATTSGRLPADLLEGVAEGDVDALEQAAEQRVGEVAVLRALVADEPVLLASRREVRRAEQAHQAALTEGALLRSRLEGVPLERSTLLAELADCRSAQVHAGRLEPMVLALRARARAEAERDDLQRLDEEARAAEQLLRAESLTAKARWLDAREQRLEAMAGELAAGLTPGDACPVCGATEHPLPAASGGDLAADEDAAGQAHESAEREHALALEALRRIQAELAAAAALAGSSAADELQSELDTAERELQVALLTSAGLAGCEDRLAALEAEESALQDSLAASAQAAAAASQAMTAAVRRVAELEQRVEAARGSDRSVADRVARLERERTALVEAAEARLEHARAARRLCESAAALDSAAAGAGLPTGDDVLLHLRPEPEVAALASTVRAWDDQAAAVAHELAQEAFTDGGLERLLAAPAPDLQGREAALVAAQREDDLAVGTARRERERSAALEQIGVEVDALLEQLDPARAEHEELARLATLVEGAGADNALRMRLSAYVLAARLEQVAEAASERLRRMSSGRYSLSHTTSHTTTGGGRGRAGLGLVVEDAWTGVDRDPSTLSGGEAFSASLALALGLADVVQAEAGGAILETLFVDEGFGSLDEDSLDEVLDVIDGLREGGRAVGLVSHVAELRARVAAQVQVTKGRSGSSVRVVGCESSAPEASTLRGASTGASTAA